VNYICRKMRILIVSLLFVVCCYALTLEENEYQSKFTKWAVFHSKNYEMDAFFKRYSIFKQNLDYINNHNVQNSSFEMEMNRFGDLTFEEFSTAYKGRPTTVHAKESFIPISETIVGAGESLDWRTKSAVNPVQDQGQCGSCYSYSGIASIEGAWAIQKTQLLKLSEQQVVDCSRSLGNEGCNGGFEKNVFQYVINNKGIGASSKYAYTGRDNQACRASSTPSVVTISSYKSIPSNNENAMMTAVKLGPISIAVDASHAFQFYSRGVLDDKACGTSLDHAINIVGFGTDATSGKDFWIVRNSWGPSWGESGYVRIVRNKNMCGLAMDSAYPVV